MTEREYVIRMPDGHMYRGTDGPHEWTSTVRAEARQVLAVLNAIEPGHVLLWRRKGGEVIGEKRWKSS